tara:strand:- start:1323 stop:2279 length:957 start_codon:yes stop_codon:yes gene_type:complete
MEQQHIRVNKEAEDSYSFAVGDELRKSIVSPWRLPLLPVTLTKRVLSHRKAKALNDALPNLVDCIFVYDLEKMRLSDQKSFTNQSLNYSENSIGIGIGNSLIDANFRHSIPTRREMDVEPKEWNTLLENFLLGIIRAYRPQKFVFVGKYPYAGMMSVLRKCQTENGFYWIHVRGDSKTIEQRSEKFTKSKPFSYFTDHDTIVRNTIFFDHETSDNVVKRLKSNGVNIISTPEHAEYLVLQHDGYDCKNLLMRNQTIFILSSAQSSLRHIPDYLLPNLIVCDLKQRNETILSVVTFRKIRRTKKAPLMPVEAKIDLWLN